MNRLLACTLALVAAALVACSAILGLQEPTIDDSIGSDGGTKSDVAGGDAGTDGGPMQLVPDRTTHIALDDTYVYYTAEFEELVGRVAKDGSSKLQLASGLAAAGFGPYEVTLDATDVFWTDAQSIFQCKKTGCNNSPTAIVDENAADAGSYQIQAYAPDDAQTVYFGSYDSVKDETTIYSVPKGVANAPVTTFLTPSNLSFCPTLAQLVYGSGQLYFMCAEGPIGSIDTTSKTVVQFTTSSAPSTLNNMVVGGSTIYYTQFTATGSIFSIATTASSASTPIALDQDNPSQIAIDQQYVYWTNGGSFNNDAAVVRCKLGSCSTTVTPLVSSLSSVFDVKSDDTSVYYSVPGTTNTDPAAGIYKVTP